eukprot:5362582-Pyramimonas_sp.AAC.1
MEIGRRRRRREGNGPKLELNEPEHSPIVFGDVRLTVRGIILRAVPPRQEPRVVLAHQGYDKDNKHKVDSQGPSKSEWRF